MVRVVRAPSLASAASERAMVSILYGHLFKTVEKLNRFLARFHLKIFLF